jgi:hypothetical protein
MFRRAEQRTNTLISARIGRSGRVIDCVVRDISNKGARLKVADPSLVPQQFELFLKETGSFRPSVVRWRRGKEVGIAFLPERRAFGRRGGSPGDQFVAEALEVTR